MKSWVVQRSWGNLLTASTEAAYLAQHVVLHLHPLVMSQQVVVLACVLLPHGIREGLAIEILACAVCTPIFSSDVLHDLSCMLHQWTIQRWSRPEQTLLSGQHVACHGL